MRVNRLPARRTIWIAGFCLGSVVFFWLSGTWWLRGLGEWLDVGVPLRPAQSVLILPGSEETRPFVAAGLIRAGYAKNALIPETRTNPDIQDGVAYATAETTRQILLKRGISPANIVMLPGSSDSTFGDAQALSRYIEQTGDVDVLIVTNAFHSRRARWVFRQVLPSQVDRLRFYSAPNGFDARVWWTSRAGRQAVLSEWIKFLFYLMYYGWGWLWCMVAVAAGWAIRSRIQGVRNVGIRTSDEPGA